MGCGLILVNGRISDRALPRYRRFAPLFSVGTSTVRRILVQSDEMKKRFEAAGAPPAKVRSGRQSEIRFRAIARSTWIHRPSRFIDANRAKPFWIAASTSADERIDRRRCGHCGAARSYRMATDYCPAQARTFRRGGESAGTIGIELDAAQRSRRCPAPTCCCSIPSANSAACFLTRVSYSWAARWRISEGTTFFEPAIFGKPVIAGPHMENFREIAEHFDQLQAMLRIESGDQLGAAVEAALVEPGIGDRARNAAEQKRGAAARSADAVLDLYDTTYPSERAAQPGYAFLWLLERVWLMGSARDRRKKSERMRRLPVPVVSIGNVTTGGTGKTPVSIELLREFRRMGAGLLTRGYGRTARDGVVFLEGADAISLALTGDEAQLCMREARVPVGIGPDRYATGMQLLQAAELRLLFLDDGFQHLQLHRDFDLVLIDALRPFGGGHLVPLGGLREPLDGLARASAFVITRADEAPNTRAIESVLRRYNHVAPIFHARTVAAGWRSDGEVSRNTEWMRDKRAIAFCGLGNPQAFWTTLRRLGIAPLARYDYGDHHQYSPSEIRRLARHAKDIGAELLLTTAKDAVNLDPHYASVLGDLSLYWLDIRTEIEGWDELLRLIRRCI